MNYRSTLKKIYLFIVLAFLYTPLFILVFFSFNDAQYSSLWRQFSIKWFIHLFNDDVLIQAILNSLLLGSISSTIATLLSVFSCTILFLNKHHKKLRAFLYLPSFLIILPDLILGVGFLMILNFLNIPFGFISLLIAHITFCIPFIVFSIISKIQNIDINHYFAALDLGASKWYTWKKIIIPMLFPAIFSAFILGFTLSFDDVMISYFVAGPEFNILPLTILSMIRSGATPELNALCSVTLLISFILILLTRRKLRNS
jgi:spermidine/putrescine transport system permease protein